MKRGEVWSIRDGNSYGYEQASFRPALVVGSDYGAQHANAIQVVWLTHTPRSNCAVKIIGDGKQPSYALYAQVTTIDKRRFDRYMYNATDEEFSEVMDGLRVVFDMPSGNETKIEELRAEIENLKFELAIGNRMYEKALDKLAECRINGKLSMLPKPEPEFFVEKEREPEVTVEEPKKPAQKKKEATINVNLEELKRKMSTPNEDPEEAARREIQKRIAGITGKANVNTDDKETIAAITGMSLQTAREIVNCRKQYGGYSKLDDLLVVPRFGTGCLRKYGDKLMV